MGKSVDKKMKKVFLVFCLFLVSCQIIPSETMRSSFPSMQAFEFSQQCPYICWLGINPGKTTVAEAKALLKASNQIDTQWDQISEGIVTTWNVDGFKSYPSGVWLSFDNGLVTSINIQALPFSVQEFIDRLGEPDKIRISAYEAEVNIVSYAIYFSSTKTMIRAISFDWIGPDPTDSNLSLSLNIEFDDVLLDRWGESQPWLGFGHIKDYLPGLELHPESDGATQP